MHRRLAFALSLAVAAAAAAPPARAQVPVPTPTIDLVAGPVTIDTVAGTVVPSFQFYFQDIVNQTSTPYKVSIEVDGLVVATYSGTYVVTNASSDCVTYGDPQGSPSCQGGCGRDGNQFLACAKVNKGMNAYECACNGAGELPPHRIRVQPGSTVRVAMDPGGELPEWDELNNVTEVTVP